MNKLKPCPFCGGEAEIRNYGRNQSRVRCKNGCTNVDKFSFRTSVDRFREQVIAAWNTRAELTCNMTWHYSDNGGSAYTCSNCGMDTYPFSKSFEHCPHCTAKVVGD